MANTPKQIDNKGDVFYGTCKGICGGLRVRRFRCRAYPSVKGVAYEDVRLQGFSGRQLFYCQPDRQNL